MKKFITLILFLGFTLVGFSQTTLIPNSNFEQALIDLGIDKGTINGSVPTADISGIKSLDVSNYNITDLTGIEDFTALTSLSCDSNQLTSLDVSYNTALLYLSCRINQLTSLDVSNNTALTYLSCRSNQLTSLDVSNHTDLTTLYCSSNQLTSLDVSNNTALVGLDCSQNQLTSLDVSNNTALTVLVCWDNQLTSLDVSNNTALVGLDCSQNQLTSLDVSNNTALTVLVCYSNQLTSLDVRNGNNSLFTDFYATNNPNLTCIFVDDVSYSTANWTDIDATTTFVNNEAECEALNTNLFQPRTKVELEAAVDGWTASPQTITADSPVPSGQGSGTYGEMNTWDVSFISDMSFLFNGKQDFNEDISNWDVSNVTNMTMMFYNTAFNQDIGGWNTLKVTDTNSMFNSSSFNQDIGGWNTSSVTDMSSMFAGTAFNQYIGGWVTSNVTLMNFMFNGSSFNQDIGGWDTSNVTQMAAMFLNAQSFNQDLTGWCVTNISSEPNSFSTDSGLDENNNPNWGTCPALGIDDQNLITISIYPNPTDNTLFISGNESPIVVSIYNVLGKEVLSIKNTNNINVQALPSGVYVIRISDGVGQTNRKFIKN